MTMSRFDLDSARDVLAEALGIQRSSAVESASTAIAIFSAGALFGAAMVLLFAPKRVGELGEEIGSRLKDVRDRMMPSTTRAGNGETTRG